MDLETLTAWRWTCRAAYEHVRDGHRRRLVTLINRFMPRARTFVELITEWRAVVGGETALAFALRDPSFEPASLEVYANCRGYHAIVEDLYCSAIFSSHLQYMGEEEPDSMHAHVRGFRREAQFRGPSGLPIYIYESTSMSPCTPISRTWTTVLMNFVNRNAFGCAYPRLLGARRGLIADLAVREFTEREGRTLGRLVAARFSLATYPTDWVEFASENPPPHTPHPYIFPCLREHFLCPDQSRFFGDRGSVVILFDPLDTGYDVLLECFMPPFGHMPVWRMWSSVMCDGGCAYRDELLARGIISITMLPAYSPSAFTRRTATRGGPLPLGTGRAASFPDSEVHSQTP